MASQPDPGGTVRRFIQPVWGVTKESATTVPVADPVGRPGLTDRASQLMLQFRKPDGCHHPARSSPGKDSYTRQAVTRLLCLQEGLLVTPWQGNMRTGLPPKRPEKFWWFGAPGLLRA